jgi:hypothetical protein
MKKDIFKLKGDVNSYKKNENNIYAKDNYRNITKYLRITL